MSIDFEIPLRTRNRTNERVHWSERAKVAKRERAAAMLAATCVTPWLKPAWVVTMTRVGPQEMDDDGLRAALKAVRDGIAARLKVDDSTPLIRWEYRQKRGEHSVLVSMEATAP
jgi:hypothetical protein